MDKHLRYMGEFLSHAGIVWRAEIWQEAEMPFAEIGSLVFEAREPLVIEWNDTSKEKVLCGSTVTLQVESPGDRTYEDLYTIGVGRIRLDVYSNHSLYWSGTLDPEFYEEPYERAAHYPVSLTFSDFGILDRKKYALAGMCTLRELMTYCLGQSGINYGSLDERHISTSLTADGSPLGLGDLKVRSDNFYDEDGEACTLKEVLEGVLQPLALRMVQRAGTIFIYDLNGLYATGAVRQVAWDGDSSTMGVDAVYNNARITWSPYAQSGNLAPAECWTLPVDKNLQALNNLSGGRLGDATYYSYHYSTELADWLDATDSGFTIWMSRTGRNAELLREEVNFFKIVPQNDGSESEGIALYLTAVRGYRTGSGSNWQAAMQFSGKGLSPAALAGTAASVGQALFRSSKVWIARVDSAQDLLLRIAVDLLLDPRFNPFEEAAGFFKGLNQKDDQNVWKIYGNFVYVPVTIKFRPDGSDKVYCWDNRSVVTLGTGYPVRSLTGTFGVWREYRATDDDHPDVWGYLCYYNADDRRDSAGVAGGWSKNRPAINPHDAQIVTSLRKAESGQYIPYPDYGAGGTVWVEVRTGGWMIANENANMSQSSVMNVKNVWNRICWILMQLPEIEIVNNVQFEQTIPTDDVEYSAEINAAAKESIEIDTVCGSRAGGVPTARGAYFDASTGRQITQLSRAGRTSQIEDLLIGTLYSQFAERHTKLSGEMRLSADGGMAVYEEQNQEGKRFIMTGEVQDVIADVCEATIVELRPDEYRKSEDK